MDLVPYSRFMTRGGTCVFPTTDDPFDLSFVATFAFGLARGVVLSRLLSVLAVLYLTGEVDECFTGLDSRRMLLELTALLSGGLCAFPRCTALATPPT